MGLWGMTAAYLCGVCGAACEYGGYFIREHVGVFVGESVKSLYICLWGYLGGGVCGQVSVEVGWVWGCRSVHPVHEWVGLWRCSNGLKTFPQKCTWPCLTASLSPESDCDRPSSPQHAALSVGPPVTSSDLLSTLLHTANH